MQIYLLDTKETFNPNSNSNKDKSKGFEIPNSDVPEVNPKVPPLIIVIPTTDSDVSTKTIEMKNGNRLQHNIGLPYVVPSKELSPFNKTIKPYFPQMTNTDSIIVDDNHCPQASELLSKGCISEAPSSTICEEQQTYTKLPSVSMDVKPIRLISKTYSKQADNSSIIISEDDKQKTNLVNSSTNTIMTSESFSTYPNFQKLKTPCSLNGTMDNTMGDTLYISPLPTTYSEQIDKFSANISGNNDLTTNTAVVSDTIMSKSTEMSDTEQHLKYRKLKTGRVTYETSNISSINSSIASCSEQPKNTLTTIFENNKQSTNMSTTPVAIKSESPIKFSIPQKPGMAANTRSRKLKMTRTLSDSSTSSAIYKTDLEQTDSTNGTIFFTNYYQSFLNIRKQVN